MKKLLYAAVAVLAFGATAAFATVTFDPSTGTGFVGKGDVQVPWGWNNQKLQEEAENVDFYYESIESADYAVTCEWNTTTGGPHPTTIHHVVTTHKDIEANVAFDSTKETRKNHQGYVTGFNLTGKSNETSTTSGGIPEVGDPCPPGGGDGEVTAVDGPFNETKSETLYAVDVHDGKGPTAIWIDGVSVKP
jgi:opacity protein-like surface antigen